MFRILGISTAFMLILGCVSATAGDQSNPAIGGYCPVAYFSADKAVKGSSEFAASHAGKTYYFVNKDALATFKKNPEKYVPAYDGWCAYGMTFGKKVKVDPKVFSIVNGTLYLNKNKRIGKTFDKDQSKHIAKADQEWNNLK